MNTHPLLQIPSRFRLPWSRFHNASEWMKVEVVATKFDASGKPTLWTVEEGGSVLSKDELDWEFNVQPSGRTDDFLARTRFATAEEAAECAAKYFKFER